MDYSQLGKLIIVIGFGLVLLGGIMLFAGRLPFFGQLPGDIEIRRGGATIFFPIATMIVISIVLTIVLNLALRR
jgi:hypothetical protein